MDKMMRIRIISLFLVLFILVNAIPSVTFASDLSHEYELAIQLLQENQIQEAEAAFKKLGRYQDASKYAMYCGAISAGDKGLYSTAVTNLLALGDFMDSPLLAVYYTALSQEGSEDYEGAEETLNGILLFADSQERIASYPEKIMNREYRKADAIEKAGKLEEALSAFMKLGAWSDSTERVKNIKEKIRARDYASANQLELSGNLEKALELYKALDGYLDSPERAKAVQKKINTRDYAAAEQKEQAGDFGGAYTDFLKLSGYRDSETRAAALHDRGIYANALKAFEAGEFKKAYQMFADLDSYEDSKDKAYLLSVVNRASEMKMLGKGLLAFKFMDAWGLINLNKNIMVAPRWESLSSANNFGLIAATLQNKYGYIDETGKAIIDCAWDGISNFNSHGYCTVARASGHNYLFGMIDQNGMSIIEPHWRSLGNSYNTSWEQRWNTMKIAEPVFVSGRIEVQDDSGKRGFLDTHGNILGKIRWDEIGSFTEGLAIVTEYGRKGYINEEAEVVIAPQYKDVLPFSEGLAAVTEWNGCKYINKENETVIEGRYSKARSFRNGEAYVCMKDGTWGVINKQGELIDFLNPLYKKALDLMDNGQWEEALELVKSIIPSAASPDLDYYTNKCKYMIALEAASNNDYETALEGFLALGEFDDSEWQAKGIWYELALQFKEQEDAQSSIDYFMKADDFSDARDQAINLMMENELYDQLIAYCETLGNDYAEKVPSIHYQQAMNALANGDTETALSEFMIADDYFDARDQAIALMMDNKQYDQIIAYCETLGGDYAEKVPSIHYQHAMDALTNGDTETALSEFSKAGAYANSKDKIKAIHYNLAMQALEQNDYETALSEFSLAKDYRDSEEQGKKLNYDLGLQEIEKKKYGSALAHFSLSRGYADSFEKIKECHYSLGLMGENGKNYSYAVEEYIKASGYKDANSRIEQIITIHQQYSLLVNRSVFFGNYTQGADGETMSPIEWIVLSVEDDILTVISRYGLDTMAYKKGNSTITNWKSSSVRQWLNGAFLKKAFTGDEQKMIMNTKVSYNQANKWPWPFTNDKIYLATYPETQNLSDQRCKPTVFVKAKEKAFASHDYAPWWRRVTAAFYPSATLTTSEGERADFSPNSEGVMVRPVMRIRISQILDKKLGYISWQEN